MTHRFFLIALASLTVSTYGQDTRYLNTNQSLLNLNPAFAGSNAGVRNQASSKVIKGFGTALLNIFSNTFEISHLTKNGYQGFAIGYTRYNYFDGDDFQTTTLTYAHAIRLGNGIGLVPALQAGIGRSRLRENFDQTINGEKIGHYADVSGGLVFFAGDFILGGSAYHINSPEINSAVPYELPVKYYVHASYTPKFGQKNLLQLGGDFHAQGDVSSSINTYANFLFHKVIVGGGYARMNYFRLPEDLPYLTCGYRLGDFILQATYSKVFTSGYGPWGHLFELHVSFNSSHLPVPKAFEML